MMIRILIICFMFCATYVSADATHSTLFKSLTDIQAYANYYHEDEKPDNNNPLNPDFESLYLRQKKNYIQHALAGVKKWFGIAPVPEWDFLTFKKLLLAATEQLKSEKVPSAQHIVIDQKVTYIVIGDLQGAFHSLTRTLSKLVDLEMLTQELALTKPEYRIVFLGNITGRSAFDLETLAVVLQLIMINKNQIIYLRGDHEEKTHWQDFLSTKKKLVITSPNLVPPLTVPLEQELNDLFNLLPSTLYLDYKNHYGGQSSVLLSHYGVEKLAQMEQLDEKVMITTQIKSESRRLVYRATEGFNLITPERGATTWTCMSCPTPTFQQTNQFFYDTFLMLQSGPPGNDWGALFFKQDVRKKDGFKVTAYNFMTGQSITDSELQTILDTPKPFIPEPTAAAIDHGDEIVVGSTIAMSRIRGRNLRHGLSLRIMHENKVKGGINGKFIRLILLEDEDEPSHTRKQLETLFTTYKTNQNISPDGTITIGASLEYIAQKEILILFPYSGADIFRKPDLKYLINYTTSYSTEARKLTEYAISMHKVKRFAIFYQNDPYGFSAVSGAEQAFKQFGITDYIKTTYQRSNLDLKSAVDQINAYAPEGILFFSFIAPAKELIRKLDPLVLANTQLFCTHDLSDPLRAFMHSKGLTVTSSRVFPDPKTCSLEIAKEYRERIAADTPEQEPTEDSFAAYIFASLFIEAAQKISGTITQGQLIKEYEQMKNITYKGLPLNFIPETRSISADNVWIDEGKAGWGCTSSDAEAAIVPTSTPTPSAAVESP